MQIFGFLAFMCAILAVGNYMWELNEGSQFTVFLPRQNGNDAGVSAFLTFWSYVIILNTVVPISLYVRCEIAIDVTWNKTWVLGIKGAEMTSSMW